VLAVAPDGGVWRVRDHTLARHSYVKTQSWLAGWALRWQPLDALSVEARIGRRFASRLRYQLQDGTSAEVRPGNANVFAVSAVVRF
jgi:hypothetical protein